MSGEWGRVFISTHQRSQTPKFICEEREKFDWSQVYSGASNQQVSLESLGFIRGIPLLPTPDSPLPQSKCYRPPTVIESTLMWG